MTYLGTLFKNLLRANLAIKIHICRTFPVFLCHLIEINATRKKHKLSVFINPSYLENKKMYTFA